jgi:hypothetical protein
MIIDCHGHCTTSPPEHEAWREAQVAALRRGEAVPERPRISDEAIRRSISENQLAVQDLRGIGLTLFSSRGGSMGHSLANESANIAWAEACNNLIHRVTLLFPGRFAGVCQLPQAPLTSPAGCVPELRRCVEELGFVGCNLNPDPTDGFWSDLPLTDRHWYPLYEAMVELDVPARNPVKACRETRAGRACDRRAIRELGAIAANDFPVYARGVTHRGPYKHGPGEINVPVAAGGLVVNAGDIVVGDENGVVAFAPGFAPELIDAATKQGEKEAAVLRVIAEGRYDRSWVALQVEKMMAI